ncbi:putative sensory transduction protein [Actinoplanes capillaceus]|uniref:Sensory transduction protein n=2 Tax=Actinoplanes campanulatus TaxID=113559 RepID=A0ABQ3WUJ6_9ACTN|nr:putative sensory transduction protein [Actinoplanes capillaceus]
MTGPGRMDIMSTRVLVVDDEQSLAKVVASYLEHDGHEVSCVFDGPAAVDAARAQPPDVVVLDLGLPGLDGIEVCRQLRTFTDCYVVMLTARADEVDKLVGLGVGADDYLTKPFSPRELVARVRVMLRRPRVSAGGTPAVMEEPARVFGSLSVDVAAREVTVGDRPVEVTRTEFDLLAALSARPRMAYSRRQLVDAVWGDGWVGDEHLVDVHVGHLRRKLGDDPAAPRFIRTVRGVGYRMGEG